MVGIFQLTSSVIGLGGDPNFKTNNKGDKTEGEKKIKRNMNRISMTGLREIRGERKLIKLFPPEL